MCSTTWANLKYIIVNEKKPEANIILCDHAYEIPQRGRPIVTKRKLVIFRGWENVKIKRKASVY